MKRLLILAWLCVLAPLAARAQGSVAVSGNLRDAGLAKVTDRNTFVRFALLNFGGNIPKVIGTNVIAVASVDFHPDTNGNISGTIQDNTTISPAGTFYQVCIFYQGQEFRCQTYLITGSTFNLNSATPLSVAPTAGPNQIVTQSFICPNLSPATTWICVHGFGDSNVQVQVFNTANAQIVPDVITLTNANTVTLTFVAPQAGVAVIFHAGQISIATNQPNAVLQNPVGSQSITGQPFTLTASVPFTTNGHDTHNGIEDFNAALNALLGGSLLGTFSGPTTLSGSVTVGGALIANGAVSANAGLTANDVTDSALTTGGCVQAGPGGHLTTPSGTACGGGSGGGITSVGLALPPQFSVSGSPVTPTTGVLSGSWQAQPSFYVFAGPALNSIGGVYDGTAATIGNSALSTLTDTPTTSHDWAFVAAQSIGQAAAPTMPGGWTKNFSAGNNGAVWNQVFNSNALISAPVTFATSANWAEILFMLRLPGGSPTIVQSQSTTGAFTTSTNTFVSNTTTGNSIIAIFCGIPSASMQASFADNQKNIYTLVGVAANGTNTICIAGMTSTILGGTTDPVTVTLNGLSTTSFFLTMEVSNIAAPTAEPVFRALQPGDFPANISGPPIQVFNTASMGSDVGVTISTNTTILSQAVTMPSTGCPCRAAISYSLWTFTSSSGGTYSFWVNDGTNNMAPVTTAQSNGGNGSTSATYSGYSPGTYSNGAIITFTLLARSNGQTFTVKAAQGQGNGPNSNIQIAISTSN